MSLFSYRARQVIFSFAFLLPFASPSYGIQSVVDARAIAKAGEQINQLKKQIGELQKMKKGLQDQLSAIGKMGQINLPIMNLAKLGQSIAKTVQCSLLNKDDLMRMMPSLSFEDIDIGSVCQGRQIYGNILFGSQDEIDKVTDLNNQNALIGVIKKRRQNLLEDAATRSLALADVAMKESEETSEAVNELEAAGTDAKHQNDRLAVIAKGQLSIIRGIAQTNQLLAMMLKQQSASSVFNNLSTVSLIKPKTEGENNG